MYPSVVVIFGLAAILVIKICSAGVLTSNLSTSKERTADDSNSANMISPPSEDNLGNSDARQEELTSLLRRQMQQVRPVKATVAALLTSFAEAFSVLSAVPIITAISFVNRVANVTNQTLHFGGELTKLPLTITNSIINELSNITFPN